MSTALDCSVGLGKEASYGVAVTPTRFFEAAETLDKKPNPEQGSGMQPGKRVNRLKRNVVTKTDVSGDLTLDATTSGLGYLINAVLGAVSNTLVPTSTPAVYQQVHTGSVTDPLASYTIQKGIPPVGGGPVIPITFAGCMADTLDLDLKGVGILSVKVGWIGKDAETATAYAAPSYPADNGLYTNTHSALGLGGTLVAATATALASGTTPANNLSDWSMSIKNNLDSEGFNLGGGGKRTRANMVGKLDITGKMTAEFDGLTLLDAYWNQTPLAMTMTLTHNVVIADTPANTRSVLQVVLPAILLRGETPKSNGGAPVKQSIDWEAYDDGSGVSPIQIVLRTLDTAP